jgi:hypothetical protein
MKSSFKHTNIQTTAVNMEVGGMCKSPFSSRILLCSLVAGIALIVSALPAIADQNPPGCAPASDVGISVFCVQGGVTNQIVGQNVLVGETILYQARIFNNSASDCAVSGGEIDITTPDGVIHNTTQGVTIPLICGVPECNPSGQSVFFGAFVPYTVRAQDVGTSRPNVAPCNPSPAGRIQATASYVGGVSHCDANNSCDPSSTISACNPVKVLGIQVTKLVACSTNTANSECANPSPGTYGSSASGAKFGSTNPKFCYSITITNSGTAPLAIDSVTDDILGPLSGLFPGGLGTNPADSAATRFVGPQTESATTTDHVTVQAHELLSCQLLPTNATASATATVVPSDISCQVLFFTNSLPVTTGGDVSCCQSASAGITPNGSTVTVVVRITNGNAAGQQSIQSATIAVGAQNFNVSGPIAPGASKDTQVDSFTADQAHLGCHAYSADIVAIGATTDSCPPITTSCNNTLAICGTPNVNIVKLVKCLTSNECANAGSCSHDIGLYAPTATGVKDAGFCYVIAITNSGQVALDNVVVTDSQLGSNLGFPTTLAVGQSATRFFEKDYPGVVGNVRNTATVSGQSASTTVSATTNAVVTLKNLALSCSKTVALNGGQPTAGGSLSVPSGSSNDLTFAVTVCNDGDVDLQNVKVVDTGVSGCPQSTSTIDFLAAGACSNFTLCTVTGVPCPPAGVVISNIVNVSAEVSTNVCSVNPDNCFQISTSSSCTNTVSLTCVQLGCRTTGGGRQEATNTCPTVVYVTHGGQVGAPFGAAGAPDCATGTGFNNPCIRGEYQHVRHIKGGLRGTFHAASNGKVHNFDSLQCACLACTHVDTAPCSNPLGCAPLDRTYPDQLSIIDGLCDDKNKGGCGPFPAPSRANKICFSGVGDYALSKGKKINQVVFRVDLEDHSEPGGTQPKGGKTPPDRYRMRMWFIGSAATDNRFNGAAGSANNLALRATVACTDAATEVIPCTLACVGGATPAPNIDDGGDLDRGNRQLHLNTGATCQ